MEFWSRAQLASMDKMLNPRTIAVVGASPTEGSYGARLLAAAMKSRDRVDVFAVNPKYREIGEMRAYPKVSDLPKVPDLVGIAVKYDKVLDVLKDSHSVGAGSALVISSGFAERGEDSRVALQLELGEFAQTSGLRMVGPNSLGFANIKNDIWPTASSRIVAGNAGPIGLVCQSGATAFGPLLLRAADSGIGLSYLISTGNEGDLDFSDFVRYLVDDPDTRVIGGFVEGFRDVRKFLAVAELAAEREKPIVLIKIGRSEPGGRAALSHTGALTGADAVYDAAFKQAGVVRATDYDDLLETANLLAQCRKPKARGIAVISHSGGIGSLVADVCGAAGLELPLLGSAAREGINAIVNERGSAGNPADVTGFARSEHFPRIMRHMIDEPDVGTLVVASAGRGDQVDQVVSLRDDCDKNVAFFWTASREDTEALDKLRAADVPLFFRPASLASSLRAMLDYHAWRDLRLMDGIPTVPPMTPEQELAIAGLRAGGRTSLSESQGRELLAGWSVDSPNQLRAESPQEAVIAAQRLGYPVVLKADSADILHKTEAGVVRLGLGSPAAVSEGFSEIIDNAARNAPRAELRGVLVQEMIRYGVEMIVSVSYDAQFGPVLLLGTGGVMVEVIGDVSRRLCPITHTEAAGMVSELKGEILLRGFRGQPGADIEALLDALVRISQMAVQLDGRLAELEINPLAVLPVGKGVTALDALVSLHAQ